MLDLLRARRSLRRFADDRLVEPEKIDRLLEAALLSPSSKNLKPWRFVVVRDRETLLKLSSAKPQGASFLKHAALAIVVCGDMSKALEGDARAFWVQDCSAATENILLAAHALGLGAVWTGLYPNMERVDAVSEVLSLTDNIIPLCTVVIGHPAEQPQPKDKWNPDNVSYNGCGGKAE